MRNILLILIFFFISLPAHADVFAASPIGIIALDCQDTSASAQNVGLVQLFPVAEGLPTGFIKNGWATEIAFCGDTTRLQTKLLGSADNTVRWNYDESTRVFSVSDYLGGVFSGYMYYCVIPQFSLMEWTIKMIGPHHIVYSTLGANLGSNAIYKSNQECAILSIASVSGDNNVSPVE